MKTGEVTISNGIHQGYMGSSLLFILITNQIIAKITPEPAQIKNSWENLNTVKKNVNTTQRYTLTSLNWQADWCWACVERRT